MNGNGANGNGIIIPPDWNPDAMNAPRVQARDYSYQSHPEAPVIHQSSHEVSSFAGGFSQPIRQAAFADSSTADGNREIQIRPGQSLLGSSGLERRPARVAKLFEREDPPLSPQLPVNKEAPARLPLAIRSPSQPPASQKPSLQQSPSEALRFLTSNTEREIATLSPGQTTAELQAYIERHVYLRLLYLMGGQTEWALRPIPNIPAADQEFWTQVLWGVHNYFDMYQVPNPAERAAQTIAQFNNAILRLKERAPLELKNAVFSHKIEGYGEYETYPKDEFAPGQRVLVYAEIGNFHSELTAEGIYRTQLKSALQFSAADSPEELIEDKSYPETEDFCRNHRRDYFHSYVVDIPARCGKGRHFLKLKIEDELSGKTAECLLQFHVR